MMKRRFFAIILALLAIVVIAYADADAYPDADAQKCGPYEVLQDCYNSCGNLCSQQKGSYSCPAKICGNQGCACKDGYARATTEASPCVPVADCGYYAD